jgi:hypothetical protein
MHSPAHCRQRSAAWLTYRLSTSDSAVEAFLQAQDADWSQTQTIPPTGLTVSKGSGAGVIANWSPVAYQADQGYYEISTAASPDGPFTAMWTTADKSASAHPLDGLGTDQAVYLRVRTFTPAHGTQRNDLWSNYTPSALFNPQAVPLSSSNSIYLPLITR